MVHCISSFEGTSYKRMHDINSYSTSSFISCSFTSQQNLHQQISFLQLFRTKSNIYILKKGFCHKFSFFNGFKKNILLHQNKCFIAPPIKCSRSLLNMFIKSLCIFDFSIFWEAYQPQFHFIGIIFKSVYMLKHFKMYA